MQKGLLLTVNYGTPKNTITYIESLIVVDLFSDMDVFVIDNVSNNENYILLDKKIASYNKGNIFLHKSDKNLGYFGAINYLVENFIKSLSNYLFIIISNNDMIIKDFDFFRKIRQNITKADIIAPRVVSLTTGKDQNPHREKTISPVQKFQYRLLYSNYYVGKILHLLREAYKKKFVYQKNNQKNLLERTIFSLHGSFFIFSHTYFQKGGYIDDGYFLYGEEDSVAAISKQIGCVTRFIPEICVYHNEHQTTEAFGFKKNIYEIQRKSYKYIKAKYKSFY